jgi:endonuclease/exonuclease/phosphatase family metal-dependent hydrolase
MRKFFTINLLSCIYLCISTLNAQIILFDGTSSAYSIVIPSASSAPEVKAASLLQDYFNRITGFQLPVMADDQPVNEYEIVIGNSNRLAQHKININQDELGQDGFIIRTRKKALFIAGETPQGTLNGVFSFLEDHLGCRFYSPGVNYIPQVDQVVLPKIKERQVPVFTYREMYFPGRQDREYREWHKLHTHQMGQWGIGVHTFRKLVPPAEFFRSNPTYFAEINGRRVPNGQLCLTQPEVYEVLIENLRKNMEKKPKVEFWSVSQNDNYQACQCTGCREAADRLGGQSGIMIDFVNRVAAEFPEKVISTLAYQYTRRAPSKVKPLPNVNIMLCSIECNRSRPIASDPSSASFVKDIKDWTQLTNNILIWDYVVQFRNYISPFPNLRVLQPNLEFFAKNNCRMMFQQGSGPAWSEFSELRSYMIAKLLWNPYQDAEKIMDDFLAGYYRSAAPFLKQYIGLMHDELERTGGNLWIFGNPVDGIGSYLRPDLIREYERLFDQAEVVVAGEPDVLLRVHAARLPLEFAVLDISLQQVDEQLSWFEDTGKGLRVRQEMLHRLDTFVLRCERSGITMLNEMGLKPEEYRRQIHDYLTENVSLSMVHEHSDSLYRHAIKVMTFNIRFDNPFDGINAWDRRKVFVTETLQEITPDIIGMQEVLAQQAAYLKEKLPGYAYLGAGRDDGLTAGEYSPVFYKQDRFKVIDWGTLWLTETPYDTGSIGWDAAMPRICTWVKFQDLLSGQDLFFLNTHFDHVGETARKESARLIVDFIQQHANDLKVILTGDFNCTPEDEPYQILVNEYGGLKDVCAHSEFAESCAEGTFNGFAHHSHPGRIDMIFTKGFRELSDYQVIKAMKEGMYISDHWPVMATLR